MSSQLPHHVDGDAYAKSDLFPDPWIIDVRPPSTDNAADDLNQASADTLGFVPIVEMIAETSEDFQMICAYFS